MAKDRGEKLNELHNKGQEAGASGDWYEPPYRGPASWFGLSKEKAEESEAYTAGFAKGRKDRRGW